MRRKGKKLMKKVFWLRLLAALLFGLPVIAGAEGRFKRFDFKLKGQVTDVITEDINGDGLRDAVAVHVDLDQDPPARRLAIFMQTKEGFDPNQKIEWNFPAEIASIDVGDVSADPGQELVFITEHGVSYSTVANGQVSAPRELMPVQSVVATAYERGVPYYNFVRDYTGDGKDDVLVVGFTEALIAIQKEGYEWVEETLRVRPQMDIQSFDIGRLMGDSEHPMYRVAYYVPVVYSIDNNSDGRVDLVINYRRAVDVFNQNAQGFSAQPDKKYKIELMKEGETGGGGRGRGGPMGPANLVFTDLDGDGKMDVIANQAKGNIASMKSRAALYWGNDGSADKNQPSQDFTCENTVMAIFVRDINKDGAMDIILPSMDLSVWTAGKVLVTGGFDVKWNIFLQKPDHSFATSPDRMFITNLKFDMSKFELAGGIPNVFGDFNGDGYPDQAVGEEDNVLHLTLRGQDGEPMPIEEKITVPVSMFNRAIDMNNDKLSDLVIHYDDRSQYVSEFHIFLNTGNWNAE
jgi:hypothetical protein